MYLNVLLYKLEFTIRLWTFIQFRMFIVIDKEVKLEQRYVLYSNYYEI